MLDAAIKVLEEDEQGKQQLRQKHDIASIEWVVVSDGSKDGTEDVVRDYARRSVQQHTIRSCWKLLVLSPNQGKGAAVRHGMPRSRGQWRLMVDADGATSFQELFALLDRSIDKTKNKTVEVVFGSRAHLQESSKAKRSFVRTVLMHAFHFFVDILCNNRGNVRDTQCGFKLFTAQAANQLFGSLHLQRWAFDIELVVLCGLLGWSIEEVPVEWHEVDGSKLDSSKLQLALVSIGMLRDMICVRLCYTLGIWRVAGFAGR